MTHVTTSSDEVVCPTSIQEGWASASPTGVWHAAWPWPANSAWFRRRPWTRCSSAACKTATQGDICAEPWSASRCLGGSRPKPLSTFGPRASIRRPDPTSRLRRAGSWRTAGSLGPLNKTFRMRSPPRGRPSARQPTEAPRESAHETPRGRRHIPPRDRPGSSGSPPDPPQSRAPRYAPPDRGRGCRVA